MQKHFFDDVFPLLVFLTGFVGLVVGPADERPAAFAENVGNGVEAGDQDAILGGAGGDVDALIEEVCSSMPSMETLRYNIIMTRQMSPAITTGVNLWSIQINHGIVFHQGLLR